MHLLNGSSSQEPEKKPEIHPAVLQGLATFKEAMTQVGLMPTKEEMQIVSDVLVLSTTAAIRAEAAQSMFTLQLIYNYLNDMILVDRPPNRVNRKIHSLKKLIETGERDDNIQEYIKRMEERKAQARARGEID